MKILLLNPPIRTSMRAYLRPAGLGSVAQHLLDAGHDVSIVDLNLVRPEMGDVPAELPQGHYDIIGLSGIITTYKIWHQMMPMLREKYPKSIFVCGGGGITSSPEEYMNNIGAEIGVLGEGEYTAAELMRAIAGEIPISDVRGLVYRSGSELKYTPPRPIEQDLDKIYKQAYHLMEMDTYAKTIKHHPSAKAELAIWATRGCPFSCKYCYHIFGPTWRKRSVEKVLDEIAFFRREWGVTSILFQDELLTANKEYLLDLCREIKNREMRFNWMCFSRVTTIDEEMLVAMRDAGCWLISYGVESGSQKILDAMNKKATVEQADHILELTRKYMWPKTTMMYGFPGETAETIQETVNFSIKHRMMGVGYYTTPYPGTAIFNEYKDKILAKYGNLHNFFVELDDATKFTINLTDMPDDLFFERRHQAGAICTIVSGADAIEEHLCESIKKAMDEYKKIMRSKIVQWN